MKITYGERWSYGYQRWFMDRTFTEAQARKRHDKRQLYTALFHDDNGKPYAAVEMCFAFGWGDGLFFDDKGRLVRRQCFIPADGGRLFMSEMHEHYYHGDNRLAAGGVNHYFKPDGSLWISAGEARGKNDRDTHTKVDVSELYIDIPAFGDFAPFLRRDYRTPPLEGERRS